jgi:hypothetical protein
MSFPGTNRPNEDVCIHGSFRRDNGHATDIARRQNLTHSGHRPDRNSAAQQSLEPAGGCKIARSARGYILPPGRFRRTDGRWKSLCPGKIAGKAIDLHPGMQVSRRLFFTSMDRPPRRLLILALQQQVDRLSDEGRGVSIFRVGDHLPHPVPRR